MPIRAGVWAVACVLSLGPACQGRKAAEELPPRPPPAYTGDELPPPEAQGHVKDGGVLTIAMEAEPPSLNYQLDPLDMWGKKIDDLLFESLARPNPRTFVHEPRLAERWVAAADNLTYTFYLRKDARWHDGKPVTADDVVFTFDILRAPSSKTMAIRSFLDPLAAYEKLDAHTVRFKLARPYWFAFDAIAEVFIYPKHVYGKGDFNTHPANRKPVGSGRYRFERWATGDEIVLIRNDAFFGERAHIQKIVFKYAPDSTVRVQMLKRGDIDVVERVPPDVWRTVAEEPEVAARFYRLRHVPSSVQWVGWNQDRIYFRDKRVRQALTMLIDRQDIVDNLRLGLDRIAVSWFYPGAPEWNERLRSLPYDPKRAADLLEDAGYKDRDGDGLLDKNGQPFSFTFLYPVGNPFYEQLAGLLQEDLKKVGIKVETARLEWAVFMERLRRHEFDACSLLWQLYPRSDPFQIWHSSEAHGGSNFISFQNPEADAMLEAARHEFDEQKRLAHYRRFTEILHEEQPYTFLFNRFNLSLVRKDLGGVYSTPYGIFRYDDFYWRAEGGSAVEAAPPTPPTTARP
jgi:peptide/nickel transport system substrate-binding protein